MGKFHEGVYEQLRTFIQQSAWLNSSPETPADQHHALKDKGPKPEPKSRIEKMRIDRDRPTYSPPMPDVDDEVAYLIGYLWQVGPVMQTGFGPVPINHVELAAWVLNTGVPLQPWEANILRQLSVDYLVQSQKSKRSSCPPPWSPSGEYIDRESAAKRIKNLFRS